MGGNNSRMLSFEARTKEAIETPASPSPPSSEESLMEYPAMNDNNSHQMFSLEARINKAMNLTEPPPSASPEEPSVQLDTMPSFGEESSIESSIASYSMPMAKACAMPMAPSARLTPPELSGGTLEPRLYHHLSERVEPLASYLALAPPGTSRTLNQRAVDELLDDLTAFFIPYATEKRALVRLAQTGRVVQQLEGFHRAVDALTARCELPVSDWKPRWRRERATRLAFFRKLLDAEIRADQRLRPTSSEEKMELLLLLKYDATKYEDALTTDELALLHRAFAVVVESEQISDSVSAALMARLPLPEWFVAPYEKSKQQRKWQRAGVTVRDASSDMNSRRCLALADTWSRLRHPHVMKLFGACHVDRERFFVVADGTPLTFRLGQQGFPLWRALHDAALALHFLHERHVVLDALSCADLVLVPSAGRDTVVLAGFKLRALGSFSARDEDPEEEKEEDPLMDSSSDDVYAVENAVTELTRQSSSELSKQHDDESKAPAQRSPTKDTWQAPELLKGESGPSVASDIFALGMCVLEAFSGGNVWVDRSEHLDGSSRCSTLCSQSALLLGRLPPRPKTLRDTKQWALVQRMCAFDPEDRPDLDEVLTSFQDFAEGESPETSTGKKPRGQRLQAEQPAATLEEVSSLLAEVQAWCDAASESSALNFQLCERLEDIVAQLTLMAATTESSHRSDSLLRALVSLITHFRDSLLRNASEKQLLRLATSRQVVDTNAAMHHELDLIMAKLELDCEKAVVHSWRQQQSANCGRLWDRMRASLSGDSETISASLSGDQERALLGAYLAFEATQRSASYSSSDLKLLQTALSKITASGSLSLAPLRGASASHSAMVTLPPWFLPPYEVAFNELDAFNRGAFGSVHFGKWLATPVVVKKVLTPEEQGTAPPLPGCARGVKPKPESSQLAEETYRLFLSEVRIWFALNHPHVVKLFGACHIGAHQFFVCEYASLGSLDSYLGSQPNDKRDACVWRLLHESALGLQHLHEQNIVHADLKCNNILVGASGVAKLTDFGLSSIHKRRLNGQSEGSESGSGAVGAYRWKAPEVLSGESATFASDVYSLAMCTIEAVSGEFPWGSQLPDAAVRFHVRKGRLPPRPKGCFSDRQWDLVERMACHEPSERLTIAVVVDLLAAMI